MGSPWWGTTDPFVTDPFEEFAFGDWIRARRMMASFGMTDMRLSPFILDEGLSLVHLAARLDLREATATLLAWGVRVDALAWPRSVASASWRALAEGLPVNIVGYGRGAFGLTPLHLAILANDEAMIRYLLANGGNPRRRVLFDGGPEGDWGCGGAHREQMATCRLKVRAAGGRVVEDPRELTATNRSWRTRGPAAR